MRSSTHEVLHDDQFKIKIDATMKTLMDLVGPITEKPQVLTTNPSLEVVLVVTTNGTYQVTIPRDATLPSVESVSENTEQDNLLIQRFANLYPTVLERVQDEETKI